MVGSTGLATGDAQIDVVHPAKSSEEDYELRRHLTLELLRQLDGNGSPAALNKLPAEMRQAAFSPPPVVSASSDVLFDAWSLTSVREELPGRPPVAEWLHGISERDPPETYVAWREEVERLTLEQQKGINREDLLDDYALKPHELLRDRADRVFRHLETMAERNPNLLAWVVESNGRVQQPLTLAKLVEKDKQNKPRVNLNGRTVILPPRAGGWRRAC